MNPHILVLYFGLVSIFDVTTGYSIAKETVCQFLKIDRKLKARCHDMNLREVPQNLKSGVEILDLTMNRIKKLKKTSFEKYSGIKYLLLHDNSIFSIEYGTFSILESMQEIDLSSNSLTSIPLELFQLPSLRNLYIDDNSLIYLNNDIKDLDKPIKAPLEYLNIAKCDLEEIPNLGVLPYLWHLNASMNPLSLINVDYFAGMCHLTSVDLSETAMPRCACDAVTNYLKHLGVKKNFFNCDTEGEKDDLICPNLTNDTIHNEDFQQCNAMIEADYVKKTWIYVGSTAAILAIITSCIIFCAIRKCRKSRRKANLQKCTSRNHVNSELLRSREIKTHNLE